MNARRTRRFTALLSFVSSSLVAVGVSLPWLKVEPPSGTGVQAIPAVYISGMGSGIEAGGWIILPLVVGSTAALVYFGNGWKTGSFTLVAGGVTVALSLDYIIRHYDYANAFMPTIGVYLTLLGGIGLVLAAGIALFGSHLPAFLDSREEDYRTDA